MKKVTLKQPLVLSNEGQTIRLPAGATVEVLDAKDGTLTVGLGGLKGEIAADATDWAIKSAGPESHSPTDPIPSGPENKPKTTAPEINTTPALTPPSLNSPEVPAVPDKPPGSARYPNDYNSDHEKEPFTGYKGVLDLSKLTANPDADEPETKRVINAALEEVRSAARKKDILRSYYYESSSYRRHVDFVNELIVLLIRLPHGYCIEAIKDAMSRERPFYDPVTKTPSTERNWFKFYLLPVLLRELIYESDVETLYQEMFEKRPELLLACVFLPDQTSTNFKNAIVLAYNSPESDSKYGLYASHFLARCGFYRLGNEESPDPDFASKVMAALSNRALSDTDTLSFTRICYRWSNRSLYQLKMGDFAWACSKKVTDPWLVREWHRLGARSGHKKCLMEYARNLPQDNSAPTLYERSRRNTFIINPLDDKDPFKKLLETGSATWDEERALWIVGNSTESR